MSNRPHCARALKVASSVALCTFAIASQADPVSLQGVCHLSSIIAGQGRCDLNYQLWDYISPGSARLSQIRVDGNIVAQYVNDTANPVDFSIPSVSGSVTVQCGVSHTIIALVAPVGTGTPYARVGTLPAVKCPAAP